MGANRGIGVCQLRVISGFCLDFRLLMNRLKRATMLSYNNTLTHIIITSQRKNKVTNVSPKKKAEWKNSIKKTTKLMINLRKMTQLKLILTNPADQSLSLILLKAFSHFHLWVSRLFFACSAFQLKILVQNRMMVDQLHQRIDLTDLTDLIDHQCQLILITLNQLLNLQVQAVLLALFRPSLPQFLTLFYTQLELISY